MSRAVIQAAAMITALIVIAQIGWIASAYDTRVKVLENRQGEISQATDILQKIHIQQEARDSFRRELCKAGRINGPACIDVVKIEPGLPPVLASELPTPE